MNFVIFFILSLLFFSASVGATIFRTNETTAKMGILSHFAYANSDTNCDRLNQPCAPLNDCWGATVGKKEYAFVGLSNGVDFLDVTDPRRPQQTSHSAFIPGCITEWRDIKSHKNAVYVVNDEVAFCTCEAQPCGFQLLITGVSDSPLPIDGVLGKIGAPLGATPVDGLLVSPPASPELAVFGCDDDAWQGLAVGDSAWVGLVDRGHCSIGQKLARAQAAGAVGLVVVSYRDDEIFPSMSGNGTGIVIPVVMIAHAAGVALRDQLQAVGSAPHAIFNASSYVYDPFFKPPEGLWVIDFADPLDPSLVMKNRDWFNAAHNILVDPKRSILYVCGMDTFNGGLLVLGIDDPLQPVHLGHWDLAYFHDVEVAFRQDLNKWILYGTAIYDAKVYMLDVNDPASASFLRVIAVWDTPDWPHNTASTPDGKVLYVTHEDFAMPITIWHVESPQSVTRAGEISIESDKNTIPHNIFLKFDRLWASYYSSGVSVFDITKPLQPSLMAVNNSMVDARYGPGDGYHGVWGIYPFSNHPSGSITYASDIETGFWVLDMVQSEPEPEGISGFGIFVVVVVILAILAGIFFLYRYMKNNNISLSNFHSKSDRAWGIRSDESHERLALDEEEEEDDGYYNHEI